MIWSQFVHPIILIQSYKLGQQSPQQRQDQKMHHASYIPNLIKNYHLRQNLQSGKDLLISQCLKIRRPQSVNAKMMSNTKGNGKCKNSRMLYRNNSKNKDNPQEKQSKRKDTQSRSNNNILGQSYKICKQQQQSLNSSCKIQQMKKCDERKKSQSKEKHPFIRSFIIKDRNQQINEFLEFNCGNQHKIFENSLNQCINKTRINNSPDYVNQNYQKKDRKASQSFNNIKVKQILEEQTKKKHDGSRNTERKVKSSYNQRRMKREDRNTKTNKTLNCESPQIVQIIQSKTIEQYSNITQYPINISEKKQGKNMNKLNDSKRTAKQFNDNIHKDNQISENFSSKGNYNGYLWQVKQKKLKKLQRTKGSPDIEIKRSANHDFLNVKMLNFIKSNVQNNNRQASQDKKYLNNKNSSKVKEYSQKQIQSSFKTDSSLLQSREKDVLISDFMVFTDIQKHTPRKRKIQMKTPSPEKRKQDDPINSQDSNYFLSNQKLIKILDIPELQNNFYLDQDSESGSSCYLRTRHFI